MTYELNLNPDLSNIKQAYSDWRDSIDPLFRSRLPSINKWEIEIKTALFLLDMPIRQIIITEDLDYSLKKIRDCISHLFAFNVDPDRSKRSIELGSLVSKYILENYSTVVDMKLRDIIQIFIKSES